MKNLIVRSLSGAVFVVLVLGSILLDPLVFSGLFLLITIMGLWEFYDIFRRKNLQPNPWLGTIGGGLVYLGISPIHPAIGELFIDKGSFFSILDYFALFAGVILLLLLIAFLLILAEIFRKKEHPFENAAVSFLGIIYVALPLALLNIFFYTGNAEGSSPELLLGLFLLVWTNDTFAYLSGMSLGKHPLCTRLSPKKTWEGSFGGAVFTLVAAYLLSLYFTDTTTLVWLIIGIVVIIFGTLGDLAESMLKRSFNIKDSGSIMPGHGGILDRFDAILMATPFVLVVLYFSNL
jgi:phosphatidate cytidylyltransferase